MTSELDKISLLERQNAANNERIANTNSKLESIEENQSKYQDTLMAVKSAVDKIAVEVNHLDQKVTSALSKIDLKADIKRLDELEKQIKPIIHRIDQVEGFIKAIKIISAIVSFLVSSGAAGFIITLLNKGN